MYTYIQNTHLNVRRLQYLTLTSLTSVNLFQICVALRVSPGNETTHLGIMGSAERLGARWTKKYDLVYTGIKQLVQLTYTHNINCTFKQFKINSFPLRKKWIGLTKKLLR